MLCLRKAKNARKSVPAHSGGVFAFFDFVEKRKHPTPKGSVREPGSLTHPQVTPIDLSTPHSPISTLHSPFSTLYSYALRSPFVAKYATWHRDIYSPWQVSYTPSVSYTSYTGFLIPMGNCRFGSTLLFWQSFALLFCCSLLLFLLSPSEWCREKKQVPRLAL